jgi:hypothetical protein
LLITFKNIAIVCIATIVGACASPVYTPPQKLTITRGDKPSLSDVQQLVMPYLKRSLKDFDSLKDYQFISGPHITVASEVNGDIQEAWMICIEYNAKNSYGGYIGIKSHTIPFIYTSTGLLTIPTQENWLHFGPQC